MAISPGDAGRAAARGDAMVVVDAHGIVRGWSEGARLLTGYAAAEITGRPVSALVDGDAAAAWRILRTSRGAIVAVRRWDGRRSEGGRGLLLVAQLTDRWGTRTTPAGKTIWAEQTLPVP